VKIKLTVMALIISFYAQASQAPADTPRPLRARVIVFVHGIHGSRESWRASNRAYWPDLIRTDPRFAYSDVDVAEYPTPSKKGTMSSVQLSEVLWASLKQDHVWEHREVVFIAHSLGGILVEEMLLRHPPEANRVKFIVSYGTPHEGSFVARLASIYDNDPLLSDLKDGSDNVFLTQLEQSWRGNNSVNGIHRFCAFESVDTKPESGMGHYFGAHTRVVRYFSATYGCDVTTPPQEILADHLQMIKPVDRASDTYDFFVRVYHDNPIAEERVVYRDNVISGLNVDCNRTKSDPDLQVPMTLDGSLREKVLTATASLINFDNIQGVNPNPPVVTRIDPNGIAHVSYGFNGLDKNWLGNCPGAGHASVSVQFAIHQDVPIREPVKSNQPNR
jgi:pimeloyl-ACP methyl ester carboxylesterase